MQRLKLFGTIVLSALALGTSAKLHAQAESQTVDGGTLSWTATYSQSGSCPVGSPSATPTPIYQWSTSGYTYTKDGVTTSLGGSTAYLVSPGGPYCPASGVVSGNPQEIGVADDITFYAEAEDGPEVLITTD